MPAHAHFFETQHHNANNLIVIDKKDNVWLTFDGQGFMAWLRWLLTPGKKTWLMLTLGSGKKVRVRAVRLSMRYIRL